jgi:hypothetical protein
MTENDSTQGSGPVDHTKPGPQIPHEQTAGRTRRSPSGLGLSSAMLEYLRRHGRWRAAALAVLLILIPGSVVVGYYSWFHGIPFITSWASGRVFPWIPGAFAIMILAILPVWILMFVFPALGKVMSLSLEEEDEEVRTTLDIVASEEKRLLDSVEGQDQTGLMPLIRYSRVQLEAYYKIGLTQTRRSFLYAVIAMWVGFAFLIIGFSTYMVPIEKLGLVRPQQDIDVVLIVVGAVIEFVSALFLWVYRSSTNQLTYFYNRQMHNHSVVMCYRIAESMAEGDETKKTIVEKVLERTWSPERQPLPTAGGISKLLGKTG